MTFNPDNVKILPYKTSSEGAWLLLEELGIYMLKGADPSRIRNNWDIINWGKSEWKAPDGYKIFNRPEFTYIALNKLRAFYALLKTGISIPDFTEQRGKAERWIKEGHQVVCRRYLESFAGHGANVANNLVDLVDAPLYTKYVDKIHEYRIHVAFGKVIGWERKFEDSTKRITGDPRIRSHLTGWAFFVDGEAPNKYIQKEAIKAVEALKLDFGGVDVIWGEKEQVPYVLEINCAPGLAENTARWYANAFREYYSAEGPL